MGFQALAVDSSSACRAPVLVAGQETAMMDGINIAGTTTATASKAQLDDLRIGVHRNGYHPIPIEPPRPTGQTARQTAGDTAMAEAGHR